MLIGFDGERHKLFEMIAATGTFFTRRPEIGRVSSMRIHLLLIAVALAALAAVPAGAFEATTLDVTIAPSGAAEVAMTYDLNWVETFVVYAAIAAPGPALETALEAVAGRKVRVREAGPDGAVVRRPAVRDDRARPGRDRVHHARGRLHGLRPRPRPLLVQAARRTGLLARHRSR